MLFVNPAELGVNGFALMLVLLPDFCSLYVLCGTNGAAFTWLSSDEALLAGLFSSVMRVAGQTLCGALRARKAAQALQI